MKTALIDQRRTRGKTNFLAGQAAENAVQRLYTDNGARLSEARWRGKGVEIDLVFEKDGEFIFVEVKKSHSHDRAAASLTHQQLGRIAQGAIAYVGTCPQRDLTPFRIDVALVNGAGEIHIIENVISD